MHLGPQAEEGEGRRIEQAQARLKVLDALVPLSDTDHEAHFEAWDALQLPQHPQLQVLASPPPLRQADEGVSRDCITSRA